MAARMEALTRPHSRTELLHPAPPESCPSSCASCTLPGQPRRHLLTIEEFNQVIAPAPIRDAMPASPVRGSPSRAVCLEPVLEEVEDRKSVV